MRLLNAVSTIALIVFSSPVLADEYVIMKVNGTDVSSSEVQRSWEGLFPQGQAPAFDTVTGDVKDRVLRAVMAEKILHGEALKQGVDKSATLQRELEDLKKKLVVRTFLDSKTADLITDADLKKEYDASIATTKDEKEVRARHILLANEKDAKDAKSKLDAGKSFEEVARDYSKDAGSAKLGGDLGYFTRDKMVPEFAGAAFALKKGELSGPVKSPFGYHIIKVEDVRKKAVPSFAESRDAIRAGLQDKKLNDYIGGLVKSADVKLFDATGKESIFNKNLPDAPKAGAEQKPSVKAEPVKAIEPKPAIKAEPEKSTAKPAVKPVEAKPAAKVDSTKPASKAAEVKPAAKPADAKVEKPAEKTEAKPVAEPKSDSIIDQAIEAVSSPSPAEKAN